MDTRNLYYVVGVDTRPWYLVGMGYRAGDGEETCVSVACALCVGGACSFLALVDPVY